MGITAYFALQRYTGIYYFQYLYLSLQFYSISYLYIVVEVGIKHEPWLETLLQSCLSRVSSKGPGLIPIYPFPS